jgi:hypothetical protein
VIAAVFVIPVGVAGGPPAKNAAEKEWTLLMYWDADNSLEFCTEFAMATWEEALPSNENVNIVALVDILSVDGVWVYEIADGERTVVAEWPEMNTSDPAVLEEFVDFGIDNYPSEKVMLIVQDHGYGWRGVCQDETNGDTLMPIDGLAGALRSVKVDNGGKGVDLVAFDACHMNTLEVAYELRDAAPYLVASQSMVPFDGLPYDMFITELAGNPEMSAAELATRIVYDYVEYYSDKWAYEHIMRYSQDFSTIAAIDLTKMGALGSAFVGFTETLLPLVPELWMDIESSRGSAQVTKWANSAGYEWMPDVNAFIQGMKGLEPTLDEAISVWDAAFADAVLAEGHSKKMGKDVYGLNFWFPPSLSMYVSQSWIWARQFVYHEVGLDIVAESSWHDCLMSYYGHNR